VSKPKPDSLRSRWTALGKRKQRALAGVAVAIAALPLLAVTMMLVGSSKNEPPPSRQDISPSNTGAVLPSGGANAAHSSSPIENPKQTAQIIKTGDLASRASPARATDARASSLVIEIPQQGATVGTREELTGRIEPAGWPVIFVQADIPGQPWWCQAPVAQVEGGRFTTSVVFGDQFTPSGTKFRVAGIVTRTREEALKFGIGSKEEALPEGYPQSVVVVVTHR
jgi:hypothetical protein